MIGRYFWYFVDRLLLLLLLPLLLLLLMLLMLLLMLAEPTCASIYILPFLGRPMPIPNVLGSAGMFGFLRDDGLDPWKNFCACLYLTQHRVQNFSSTRRALLTGSLSSILDRSSAAVVRPMWSVASGPGDRIRRRRSAEYQERRRRRRVEL